MFSGAAMTSNTSRENPLAGKLALITGGAHPIGHVFAGLLATAGAKVLLCDFDPLQLEPVVRRIRESGGDAETYLMASEREEIKISSIPWLMEDNVKINILVNALSVQFALKTMNSVKGLLGQDAVILNVLKAPDIQSGGTLQTSLTDLTRSIKNDFADRAVQVFGLSLAADLVDLLEDPQSVSLEELARITIGLKDLSMYLCGPLAKEINGRVFELKRMVHQGD